MGLVAGCPRCATDVEIAEGDGRPRCPLHGEVSRPLWRPHDESGVSYDGFTLHLDAADGFPTYVPWPMSPGWAVTDFAVVAGDRPWATLTCVSGTSELDGPVDVLVVAEEPGTGLGSRCAGIDRSDPGREVGEGQPAARVRIGSQSVPLWVVSTSSSDDRFDRSVFAGEADGRWLWLVLRPASAMLLLRDDWILRDVSSVGPQLVEMAFGGPRPVW
ncbi:DUF6758 family protein [Nocardioides agariphilus]|jgi:hypothetical protein|uniref:DUF6758 family protein n=1 Tax=Nocardioides agariphilus TaxID=433664 RepID=UPI001E4302C9|nr:DUF6758 family protein [Nocardioides agariphilus]